jgi:hypothetical protein
VHTQREPPALVVPDLPLGTDPRRDHFGADSVEVGQVDGWSQLRDRTSDVAREDVQRMSRQRRDAPDPPRRVERDHRNVRASEKIVKVVRRPCDVGVPLMELLVDRGELLVDRLELLGRRLELFVRALELLVARQDLFVGRGQAVVDHVLSFDHRVQVLAGRIELGLQPHGTSCSASHRGVNSACSHLGSHPPPRTPSGLDPGSCAEPLLEQHEETLFARAGGAHGQHPHVDLSHA